MKKLFLILIGLLVAFPIYIKLSFVQSDYNYISEKYKQLENYYKNKTQLKEKFLYKKFDQILLSDNLTKYKLIILPDATSCQPCYETLLHELIGQENNNNVYSKMSFNLILPSRNSKFVEELRNQLPRNINLIRDSTLLIREEFPTAYKDELIILLVNRNNLITYIDSYSKIFESNTQSQANIIKQFINGELK